MKKIYLLLLSVFFLAGQSVWSQCTNTSQFGTVTAPANNTPVTITTCAFGGEYSTINGCVAGSTYLFTATGGAGNFITIRQGTPGGTVLGFGNSPVSVVCTVSGPLYIHYNTNAACGTDAACHTGVIQCTSCSGPPPVTNDLCTGAININCGQTIAGTTIGATLDAVADCGTVLNSAPGVWYSFVGNGTSNTLSLCGSGYDTKIGVFTGTCAALTCVTGNDDFCGLQSQVTFNTVVGTTYFVLVTGFGSATGTFSLARTCVAPANDACAAAIPITCTQTIVGSTSGATLDAVATCVTALNTAPGVWYSFPGDGFSTTLSLCGSSYDTKIGVFSGTCGALVCVTGNDDFCSTQSQVTFTSVVGTNYFVLVTGFSTNSGVFTLARTCVLPPCLPSTITPAAPTVCAGIIQPLTATSSNPGNPAHIWAPVTELFTDAAATIPYTGTALATVYARPSITRTYTATLSTTSCTPTPASVIVTVNPNPAVFVIADPGTTICEGDPTLLTVVTGSGVNPVALTQSTSTTITPLNSVSCNAGTLHTDNSYWRAYNLAPLGLPSALTVTTVTFGVEQATGGAQPVTVRLYTQNAGPAFPGGTRTLVGTQAASVPNQALSLFTVTFGTPVVVPANAVLIVELFTPNGQATNRSFFIGSNAAAQTGTSYLSAADCGIAVPTDVATIGFPNMHIILNVGGTTLGVGGPATGTFLWTPAAGLSSTTSNPVAASPMNTTTYTVTVTQPNGCVRTAQTLITVNKRPVVTTQPINTAICSGSVATFTVGGTGTGLTYQWQESQAGCAGPWTNLTNGGIYSGVNTATLSINPVTGTMSGYAYRAVLSGTCAPFIPATNVSGCAVLTVNPLPVVAITPAFSCGGIAGTNGTQLSVGSAPPPVPGSVTVNSGAINVPIPEGIFPAPPATAGSHTITVAGVPANATVTGISVKTNITHAFVGDVVMVLKAPNGAIINLDAVLSATNNAGANFVNTTISSTGTTALSAGTAPFTGTFKADLVGATFTFAGFTLAGGPVGFTPTATTWSSLYSTPNGSWTIAAYDAGDPDVGSFTSWEIKIDYTTPGTTSSPLTYVWSPLTGLYNDAGATVPYTGTNTPVVYAAPTVFTAYTVTATNTITGCVSTSTAFVNYTPPAPTVTPNPVVMCLGDPAVLLRSSSTTTTAVSFTSGTINVAIPEGTFPTGPYNAGTSTIAVSGIPAAANISKIDVKMNIGHAFVGDVVAVLQAPNGQRINLDAALSATNNAGVDFVNTVISSAGTTLLSAGTAPFTGTFKADAVGATFTVFGFTLPGGPIGFIPTTSSWNALYPNPNGNWTLALYDAGAPDVGSLTNWSMDISYVIGVPATPAVWTPAGGLYSNAGATIPYVAGTPVDSVWTRPTPSGVYNYQATVQSLPAAPLAFSNPALITINPDGNASPYPSNVVVSGLPPTGVSVKSVTLTGVNHSWSDDIDVVLQSPSGQNVILMSDIGAAGILSGNNYTFDDLAPTTMTGAAPASGTYKPTNFVGTIGVEPDNWPAPGPGTVNQPTPTLSTFTGNMNGTWKLFVFDDAAGDGGSISGGFSVNFNLGIAPCTSPARTVTVTVNQPTTIATQPVDRTICTDKVATFTVAGGGTGPFSYQWQVSTNNGNNPWANITNGGVYSGATSATLTITQPPVSMSGNHYRAIVTGAAPCSSATSLNRILIVNPLPAFTISNSPTYTSLFPGLTTTLSATVTTPSAPSTYSWLRNGVQVATTPTYLVDIDRLGTYRLSITDLNGCTALSSNSITIKDSVSGTCFIYPNPTSGQFEVRYYSSVNNIVPRALTVYDAKGDRVFTKLYPIGRPYDRMPVDMRAYSKGLYWVEITDVNGIRLTMCRVVIQ